MRSNSAAKILARVLVRALLVGGGLGFAGCPEPAAPPPQYPPPQPPPRYTPPPPVDPCATAIAPPANNPAIVETICVAANRTDPVYSRQPLFANQNYVIQAMGTFSSWNDHPDGLDAIYCYGKWRCAAPEVWSPLVVDDRPLADISRDAGSVPAMAAGHNYSVPYRGTDRPLKLAIAPPRDSWGANSGALFVRILRGPAAPLPGQ